MEPPVLISVIVAVIGAGVSIATWLTSARKSRVDNLVRIIDAQSKHITELEGQVRELRDALDTANLRITELEAQNRRYRRKLLDARIDPDDTPVSNAP